MATDDLRHRLAMALTAAASLDALEAVARAHASERIESFVAAARYCPYCGAFADDHHREGCPLEED
jgi:hypothetical protein